MRRFSVEQIDSATAYSAWSSSSQALIFTDPLLLEGLCARVDWWVGTFRGNPIFYWPVCLNQAGTVMVPALPKYVGPFATDDFATKAIYRQWSIQGDLFPAFLSTFAQKYGQIAFTTPPGQHDVRQFAWWSDSNQHSLLLNIQPRYTAVIKGLDTLSDADLLAKFRRDRKAQLSRTKSLGIRLENSVAEQEVFLLYQELMRLKGKKYLANQRAGQVNHIVQYAQKGNGKVIACKDSRDSLIAVVILLYSRSVAHSIMAMASEAYRRNGIIAFLEFQAIKAAMAAGKGVFDFLGANSETGASEKHSYGATPEIYFKVESRR